jgi:5'-nucleotidase
MGNAPPSLKNARILVSNDDGINAPGLKSLVRIAKCLTDDVWTVAPETEQSTASHSLTVRSPLRIRKVSSRRFAVTGTPSDCVLLAVCHLLKDRPPDLVLSGVNDGANLAEDITHSGTVAAAMEATLLGIPAIALSQMRQGDHPVKWPTVEHFGPRLVRKLYRIPKPREVLFNINFPDLPPSEVTGIEITRQGRRRQAEVITAATDPRDEPYYWLGGPRRNAASGRGSDLTAVSTGAISVTPLDLDLTDMKMVRALKKAFA